MRGEAARLVLQAVAQLVQHGVHGALLEMAFLAATLAALLAGRQHVAGAAGHGLELLHPFDGTGWQRHGEAFAGFAVLVGDEPFGPIKVHVLPLGAGQFADARAGDQQQLHGQGVFGADGGQGGQDRPQFGLGELEAQPAGLRLAADR